MSKYYSTIENNDIIIEKRVPFDDYKEAMHIFSKYYKSKSQRSVLNFTTELINGRFARSYIELNLPENISMNDDTISTQRYLNAVKHSNAFEYEGSYFFLVESELGIEDSINLGIKGSGLNGTVIF